mgnify:CR=1 FL=1
MGLILTIPGEGSTSKTEWEIMEIAGVSWPTIKMTKRSSVFTNLEAQESELRER